MPSKGLQTRTERATDARSRADESLDALRPPEASCEAPDAAFGASRALSGNTRLGALTRFISLPGMYCLLASEQKSHKSPSREPLEVRVERYDMRVYSRTEGGGYPDTPERVLRSARNQRYYDTHRDEIRWNRRQRYFEARSRGLHWSEIGLHGGVVRNSVYQMYRLVILERRRLQRKDTARRRK